MNSSSAVTSLAEAVLAANVNKLDYNALASTVLVIVKFNCYHKDNLKLMNKKINISTFHFISTTVKPPRRDRIGDGMFGPCREVGPISEVLFVMVFFR